MTITLNPGQENAIKEVHGFLSSSDEQFMVISGPPGTGKTTVVQHIVDSLDKYHKTRELLGMKGRTPLKVVFTATTNKACDSLRVALGAHNEIRTIHSHLGLIMGEDPKTRKDMLMDGTRNINLHHQLIFIDEASYVDPELMEFIKAKVQRDTKVIFIGDPAQLKNVSSKIMPAFDSGFREAALTKIERTDESNPLQPVCQALRAYILSGYQGTLPPPIIDNKHVFWFPREKFDALLLKDMTSADWAYNTSKLLAWRNRTVVQYNRMVNEKIQGSPTFLKGDYGVNNQYVAGTKVTGNVRTDAMVLISEITPAKELGIDGYSVTLDDSPNRMFFMPGKHSDIARMQRQLLNSLTGDYDHDIPIHNNITRVKNNWIDLRPVYAQTVFKAQGANYRRVYVDLSDIGACPDYDQKIRMLLVAISRARLQVFLTGDL